MNEHTCVKCKIKYSDNEEDDYYCPPCNEQKKVIAKEIDEKFAKRVLKRKVKSDLQIYDEICKARGTNFVNINDMGISIK